MRAISGKVVRGQGLARRTGFPTINIAYTLPHGETLNAGVYAARVKYNGRSFDAAASVGAGRSEGDMLKLEAYLFEACARRVWYGKKIQVTLLKKTRDLVDFQNQEDARRTISHDVERIRAFFRQK